MRRRVCWSKTSSYVFRSSASRTLDRQESIFLSSCWRARSSIIRTCHGATLRKGVEPATAIGFHPDGVHDGGGGGGVGPRGGDGGGTYGGGVFSPGAPGYGGGGGFIVGLRRARRMRATTTATPATTATITPPRIK